MPLLPILRLYSIPSSRHCLLKDQPPYYKNTRLVSAPENTAKRPQLISGTRDFLSCGRSPPSCNSGYGTQQRTGTLWTRRRSRKETHSLEHTSQLRTFLLGSHGNKCGSQTSPENLPVSHVYFPSRSKHWLTLRCLDSKSLARPISLEKGQYEVKPKVKLCQIFEVIPVIVL